MPGLTFSNELISRDEGLHTDFAIELYNLCNTRLSDIEFNNIICEAVEIEKEFNLKFDSNTFSKIKSIQDILKEIK